MQRGTTLLGAALVVTALLFHPAPSSAQSCTVTRDQLAADVNAGMTPEEIDAKYANCVAEEKATPTAAAALEADTAAALAAGTVIASPLPSPGVQSSMIVTYPSKSSVFYEEVKACGYHPQREELVCTAEIKQRFGFIGVPAIGAGSNEYVLFCVDYGDGLGLVPVHTNGVHVHDEPFGVQPRWYFGVVVQSNPRLLALVNNGRTLKARAILSWNAPPAACNTAPIWGNWLDFRIRLDP
jgi:hypothetical protein